MYIVVGIIDLKHHFVFVFVTGLVLHQTRCRREVIEHGIVEQVVVVS
jgi:hypothetical protein